MALNMSDQGKQKSNQEQLFSYLKHKKYNLPIAALPLPA